MSNKRITDLTELINPTTDDVFPVVDIATNTTTKVQLGNIPLPTSVINALSTKENTITGAATTITSANLTASRAVISNASGKVAVSSVTDTELGYVSGVTSAIQTQIDGKQATLVSGTNIKTINSTSLLGSGDISIQANPSGVAGAIQFSNGSAFASDATNFFWDDTNNRLGIGTNTPSYALDVSQNINGNLFARLENTNAGGFGLSLKAGLGVGTYTMQWSNYLGSGGGRIYPDGVYIGQQSAPTARLQIKGSGSTSATTSLLVQNSASSNALQIRDDRVIICAGMPTSSAGLPSGALWNDGGTIKIV